MTRLLGPLFALAIVTASCGSDSSPAPSARTSRTQASVSASADNAYLSGFRHAYLPVVTTLNDVTSACVRDDMTVALLPACGRRVTAFRAAIAHLGRYVHSSVPPIAAQDEARTVTAALRGLQRSFGALVTRIEQRDLAGFVAMAGLSGPLDRSIQSFITAVLRLQATFPGADLPIPG